jgi:hypothetical protein
MHSYMLNSMDFVRVGNRTSKPLTVVYDGKSWPLPPYPETRDVPRCVAEAACRQHPVMGTEDPYAPLGVDLLVYVEGTDQPSTPIEQSDAIERLDRSQLPLSAQTVEVISGGRRRAERTTAGRDSIFDGR